MMEKRKTEVVVGIAVTLALLILILGIIWGKGVDLFSHRVWLVVRFENVGGLERGDPVVIRGLKQGEVETIVLKPECAEVRLWIKENVPLFSDVRVTVESKELMAGKQVAIDPGRSGRPVDLHNILYGESKGDITELFSGVGKIVARADSVFRRLEIVLDKELFTHSLENVKETTQQAGEMVKENRQGIRLAIQRLEALTQRLQEDSTAVRLGEVVTQLDSTVLLIHRIALRLEKEEGTLGKMIRDRDLYDQLLKTSADLDSLVSDIRSNPKKYIRISIF